MVRERPQARIVLMADLPLVAETNARNRKRIAKAVDDLAELSRASAEKWLLQQVKDDQRSSTTR
ncbi:MAG: hypothetical protein AB8I08_34715 [Sandaracinaceae bacterium]